MASNGTPQFVPPVTYTETATARTYWGSDLVAPTCFNPRPSSLIVAICDYAQATTSAHRPIPGDNDFAMAYLMPETFSAIITTLFKFRDPYFGPPELIEEYGEELFDDVFAAYYTAFRFDILWSTREGCGNENALPLIRRKMLHLWLRRYIEAYPDEFWSHLNIILRDTPSLIDPITEAAFEELIIPRSCFPAVADTNSVAFVTRAAQEFDDKFVDIVEAINAAPARRTDQEQYDEIVAEARLAKERHRDMFGGWKTDEDGNRTYVEGWM